MKKGYRILWAILAEVLIFIFFTGILPRLNAERILYRKAAPILAEAVADSAEGGTGSLQNAAGYPCTEPTGRLTSAAELKKYFIAALEGDASQFEATGIYKQINHRPMVDRQRGYYGSRSSTYGITAPAITRSRFVTFCMRPYADYAEYYLVTLEDGSRTWALVDPAITKIPRTGTVRLPVGYYWDEGAARFLNEKEKEKYRISDQDIREDWYLGDAIDLYSGWISGKEMEQYRETMSLVQSVGCVVSGTLLFATLIWLMIPERKHRGKR